MPAPKLPRADPLAHTEALLTKEIARLWRVVPPWLAWAAALILAAALHHNWPSYWAGVPVMGAAVLLAWLLSHLTHHRKAPLARWLAASTMLLAGAWLALAVGHGLGHFGQPVLRAWLFGGGSLCLAWSIWLHHHDGEEQGPAGAGWFVKATAHSGRPGIRLRVTEVLPARITGILRHPPGVTTDEVAKELPSIESAAGLPPRSLKVTEDPDHAGRSKLTIVNPAALAKSRPWQRPSEPNGSIADPIELGTFADETRVRIPIGQGHWQIMGMTGAAKTTGLGWTMLAELFTRREVAIQAVDLAKGEQFLGCMRPALHRLATDPKDARDLLHSTYRAIRPRTDYLADMHLTQWEPACGLSLLITWIEEASWVFNTALSDRDIEKWVVPAVVAARSAGVLVAFSIQRADCTMMPTQIRAQMGRITMGVAGSEDAQFGLTDYQADHNCAPDRWTNERPGMFYIDVPGIPEQYKLTEARTDYWGPNSALMRQHALHYPASARPMDAYTAAHLDPAPAEPETTRPQPAEPARETVRLVTQPAAEEAAMTDTDEPERTEYDDPALWMAAAETGGYDAAETAAAEASAFRFGSPEADAPIAAEPVSADEAAARLEELISAMWRDGERELTMDRLAELCEDIGRDRTWPYHATQALVSRGVLEQHDRPRRWTILSAAA